MSSVGYVSVVPVSVTRTDSANVGVVTPGYFAGPGVVNGVNVPGNWILDPASFVKNVGAHTAAHTIGSASNAATASNALYTNTGATGTVAYTLPTAAVGLSYDFCCTAAHTLTVAGATNTINASDSLSGSGASVQGTTVTCAGGTSGTQYARFNLTCFDGTNWVLSGDLLKVSLA
jgi:hypothetical protein